MNVLATILIGIIGAAGDCRQLLDDASGNQTGTRAAEAYCQEKLGSRESRLMCRQAVR